MSGKGSKRRPSRVSDEEFTCNWNIAFGTRCTDCIWYVAQGGWPAERMCENALYAGSIEDPNEPHCDGLGHGRLL
jgi:hypothetical protein